MTTQTGYIAELNHEGDTKYTWDRKNNIECTAAKEHFEKLRDKGFIAFKVKIFGRKGVEVQAFDKEDGGYIFTAPEIADLDKEGYVPIVPELTREFNANACYVMSRPLVGG